MPIEPDHESPDRIWPGPDSYPGAIYSSGEPEPAEQPVDDEPRPASRGTLLLALRPDVRLSGDRGDVAPEPPDTTT
jgi:hypothetical protein